MTVNSAIRYRQAFTLLEMSIVLVIIGLLVGSVFVGRDLIAAAAVRGQIAQIDKFNSAVIMFDGKYGYLPGDIIASQASQFGLAARGPYPGEGDGNGIIQGACEACPGFAFGYLEGAGETVLFWEDLAATGLIEGSFSTATAELGPAGNITNGGLNLYFPAAKIGNGNYVYVWNTNLNSITTTSFSMYPENWFGISGVNLMSGVGYISSTTNISVAQAYSIDLKIDDGFPVSGNVQAVGLDGNPYWAIDNTWGGQSGVNSPVFNGGPYPPQVGSAITCFDDGNNLSNPWKYSTALNGGNGMNCALSFRMKVQN